MKERGLRCFSETGESELSPKGGLFSNRENVKRIDGEKTGKVVTPSADEEVREVVRKSQVNPLPQISHPKPARESTMRNVLNAVNRIQESEKARRPRDLSVGSGSAMLY